MAISVYVLEYMIILFVLEIGRRMQLRESFEALKISKDILTEMAVG